MEQEKVPVTGNWIAAVIVTYNRKELLKKCLEAVFSQKDAVSDAIVIDNASTDGTGKFIRDTYGDRPGLIYVNTGENLGGAGGFQVGVREAVNRNYSYIWIMDDDTLPNESALSALLCADRKLDGRWGFLSSVAYWTDGSICRMNIQKRNIFKHIGEREYNSDIASVKMCSFVSLLVRSDVVRELGLPIGEYFIWTDDYEFTGRISRKYPCYMVPESKVVHAMKSHIRVNFAKDDASRIDRYHYIYRNDVHCYRQYGLAGWCYILLKDAYTIFDILRHSETEKGKKIKVVLRGFHEGLTFRPMIEKIGGGVLCNALKLFCPSVYLPIGIVLERSNAA